MRSIAVALYALVLVSVVASAAHTIYQSVDEKNNLNQAPEEPRYKSVGECSTWNSLNNGICKECCRQFGLEPADGRMSFPLPSERTCKCVTKEERAQLDAKEAKEWEEFRSKPRFSSVGQCSTWNYDKTDGICKDCCHQFNMEPATGRMSFLFPDERVCKCVTKEEKAKLDAQEAEKRAKQ